MSLHRPFANEIQLRNKLTHIKHNCVITSERISNRNKTRPKLTGFLSRAPKKRRRNI